MTDLWPDDFGTGTVTPPVKILREQADALTRKTKGVIVANVITKTLSSPSGFSQFSHSLILEVPSLDNYTFAFLQVTHGVLLFPVTLNALDQGWVESPNQDHFTSILKKIFASDDAKRVISGLLSQAIDPLEPVTT